MEMMLDPGYTAAGALTGFVVGLTGVGGGALMTPLLLLVWGISPVTAVATDLWFAAITKLVGAGVHHQTGQIDWKIARKFWLGSLPMALLMVLLMGSSRGHIQMEWLSQLIATVLLMTAVSLVAGPRKIAQCLRPMLARFGSQAGLRSALTIAAGAIIGVLVSLTSIGAGALGSVFLLVLYPTRMSPQRLVATDIVHAIPLSIVAGLGYLFSGLVDIPMLSSLLLGSIPAVLLGSLTARYLRGSVLRAILAVLLAASGLKIFLV